MAQLRVTLLEENFLVSGMLHSDFVICTISVTFPALVIEPRQDKPPEAFSRVSIASVGATANFSVASRVISRIFRMNTASVLTPYAALVIATSPSHLNKRNAKAMIEVFSDEC